MGSRNPIRLAVNSEIEGFMVILIQEILHRLVIGIAGSASVGHFRNPVQIHSASLGHKARSRDSDAVNRKNTAAILKQKKEGTTRGLLKPRAVMKRRTVVSDRRVIAPRRDLEVIAGFVLEHHALNVEPKLIGGIRANHHFAQEIQGVRELRRYKEIELSFLESCMPRRAQWRYEGVGNVP